MQERYKFHILLSMWKVLNQLTINNMVEKTSIEHIKRWAAVYHRPQYKTAILAENNRDFYIVTRVNYMTAKLWLENIYNKVNGKGEFVGIPTDKPNWLCMIRKFRREKELLIVK